MVACTAGGTKTGKARASGPHAKPDFGEPRENMGLGTAPIPPERKELVEPVRAKPVPTSGGPVHRLTGPPPPHGSTHPRHAPHRTHDLSHALPGRENSREFYAGAPRTIILTFMPPTSDNNFHVYAANAGGRPEANRNHRDGAQDVLTWSI